MRIGAAVGAPPGAARGTWTVFEVLPTVRQKVYTLLRLHTKSKTGKTSTGPGHPKGGGESVGSGYRSGRSGPNPPNCRVRNRPGKAARRKRFENETAQERNRREHPTETVRNLTPPCSSCGIPKDSKFPGTRRCVSVVRLGGIAQGGDYKPRLHFLTILS